MSRAKIVYPPVVMHAILQEEEKKSQVDAAKERLQAEDDKMKAKRQDLDRQAEDYAREMQEQEGSLGRVRVRMIHQPDERARHISLSNKTSQLQFLQLFAFKFVSL